MQTRFKRSGMGINGFLACSPSAKYRASHTQIDDQAILTAGAFAFSAFSGVRESTWLAMIIPDSRPVHFPALLTPLQMILFAITPI
jgi:hypothetical protein